MSFFKTNWEHFINFIKFVSERILSILLTLIFVLIVTFLFFKIVVIQNPEVVESQEIFLCGISLDNLGTWFTFVGLIITAFWSIHQYNKNITSTQQEKASEIAQKFSNNLIERMGLISEVLMQNQEVEKIIKIIHSNKISQFTVLEVQDIFNNKDCINNFEKIIRSRNTQKRYDKILEKNYNAKEREKFDSNFHMLVGKTLNELEAICISISSKAAGSQFIYESLHQMFLNTVEILYLKISSVNFNNVDKYYTNIISVYNMWNIQKNRDIKKLEKIKKKIQKNQEKTEKEIKKLLNKQVKTV